VQRARSMRRWSSIGGACALVLVGAFYFVSTIIGDVRAFSPMPLGDMWDGDVRFYEAITDGDWWQWYSLAGQHRIVFTRLFFWIDMRFFRGLSVSLVVVNGILMSILWAQLYWAATVLLRDRKRFLLAAGSLLAVAVFSWMQWENITWGNQTQYFAAYAFPLGSFQCFAQSLRVERGGRWFALAVLLGAISVVTMGNGTFALPLLAVLVVLSRRRVRARLALILPICAAVFFAHSRDMPPGEYATSAGAAFVFFFQFLGSPIGIALDSHAAGFVAGVGVAAGIVFTFAGWLASEEREPMFLALIGFAGYVALSAAAAAAARAGRELCDPFASRYSTTMLLGWSALAILLAKSFRDSPRLSGAVASAAVIAPIVLLPSQLDVFGENLLTQRYLRAVGALALDLGVHDAAATIVLYPLAPELEETARIARRRNLTIFGLPELVRARTSLGQSASSLGLVPCVGQVESQQALPDDPRALRVQGWAYERATKRVPEWLFLTDEHGIVIGAAVTGGLRSDLGAQDERIEHCGFAGYVRSREPRELGIYRAP
jgi:hypothetical protein